MSLMHSVVASVQSTTENGFSGWTFRNPLRPEGASPSPSVTSLFKANDHEFWWCHTTSKVSPETQ